MSTYVITLHGVLQQPNGAPNPQGIALYHGLLNLGRVAVLGGLDRQKDEWFLATQGLIEHVEFLPEFIQDHATELGRRLAQIGDLRSKATRVELVVEPDPDIVAALYEEGIPTLLYLHPRFTHPAFRPDYKSVAKPWATLTEAVQYQERLKASHVLTTEEEDD